VWNIKHVAVSDSSVVWSYVVDLSAAYANRRRRDHVRKYHITGANNHVGFHRVLAENRRRWRHVGFCRSVTDTKHLLVSDGGRCIRNRKDEEHPDVAQQDAKKSQQSANQRETEQFPEVRHSGSRTQLH